MCHIFQPESLNNTISNVSKILAQAPSFLYLLGSKWMGRCHQTHQISCLARPRRGVVKEKTNRESLKTPQRTVSSLLQQSPDISMCTMLTSAANIPGYPRWAWWFDILFSPNRPSSIFFSEHMVKNHKPHLAIRDSFHNNSASTKDVVQTSAIIKNHSLPYHMDSGD